MITFELFPGVSHMLKKQCFDVEFAGGTLFQALQGLIAAYPALADDLLDTGGNIKYSLATFVNDERISGDERDKSEINDGDKVVILSPISGG